jgi:hypothetical protein
MHRFAQRLRGGCVTICVTLAREVGVDVVQRALVGRVV